MKSARMAWLGTGVLTGAAGLAASHAVAMALRSRSSPLVAVAETVIEFVPGAMAERAIQELGHWDKPVLVAGVLLAMALLSALAGLVSRTRRGLAVGIGIFVLLAAVGAAAILTRPDGQTVDLLPVFVGLAVWLVVLTLLAGALRLATEEDGPAAGEPSSGLARRGFLVRVGAVAVAAAVVGAGGQWFGRGRRRIEEARSLLRLPLSEPLVPRGTGVDVPGVQPWQTPSGAFYQVHTAVVVPTIDPAAWRLRVHGLVERELELTLDDLLARPVVERWMTLNCVSNTVGGDLIGNAWWTGTPVAGLLAEAGVRPEADAVLQTSEDGWTCSTPLSSLMRDRTALLAYGMNGEPLPIEHGFPVRTLVPGLYGYVSATKWVVDLEVTRFDDVQTFWTQRGWAERGPVKLASRVDVPTGGETVAAGRVMLAGSAWQQTTGIERVEVALDGAGWQPAELGRVPNDDTWVQWRAEVDVSPGDHSVRVRAVSRDGEVQTGTRQGVLPDGATGWHRVDFSAE